MPGLPELPSLAASHVPAAWEERSARMHGVGADMFQLQLRFEKNVKTFPASSNRFRRSTNPGKACTYLTHSPCVQDTYLDRRYDGSYIRGRKTKSPITPLCSQGGSRCCCSCSTACCCCDWQPAGCCRCCSSCRHVSPGWSPFRYVPVKYIFQ